MALGLHLDELLEGDLVDSLVSLLLQTEVVHGVLCILSSVGFGVHAVSDSNSDGVVNVLLFPVL